MSQIISLYRFLLLLCDLKQALKATWGKTALSKNIWKLQNQRMHLSMHLYTNQEIHNKLIWFLSVSNTAFTTGGNVLQCRNKGKRFDVMIAPAKWNGEVAGTYINKTAADRHPTDLSNEAGTLFQIFLCFCKKLCTTIVTILFFPEVRVSDQLQDRSRCIPEEGPANSNPLHFPCLCWEYKFSWNHSVPYIHTPGIRHRPRKDT